MLPFVNMSSDPENDYFSDGLTEELIHALAVIPALHVAARTSTFQFKGKAWDVAEIGHVLGVAKIVEGSVRKSGERIEVEIAAGEPEDVTRLAAGEPECDQLVLVCACESLRGRERVGVPGLHAEPCDQAIADGEGCEERDLLGGDGRDERLEGIRRQWRP